MRQNLNHIAEEMTQFVPLLLATVDNKDGKQHILQSMSPKISLSATHEMEKDLPSKQLHLNTQKGLIKELGYTFLS